MPAAQQLDITTAGSGYRYRLFMSVPPGPVPPGGYPVLYVLDGNASFPVAAFLARNHARRSEVTGLVAPLIVGIGYPDTDDFDFASRKRDYTIAKPGEASADEGGADLFLDMIERDIKSLVARRYPVDVKRQALFGHSFGGLLVVHALLTRPTSFSTFIASSPSIWWEDKQVLMSLPAIRKLNPASAPQVQISVGAQEDDTPKGNYSAEILALLASRPMIPAARDLSAQLGALPGWTGKVTYIELAGEDHGTAWLPALSRGMQRFMEQP